MKRSSFHDGTLHDAVVKGADIINRRTRYVRAMNIVVVDAEEAVASCHFGEDPEYFQLRVVRRDGLDVVCSESYPGEGEWARMDNGETRAFPLVPAVTPVPASLTV